MTSKEDGLLRLLRHLGTLEADSAAGSAAGLAKALGVSVSTIRSWLTELGWRGLVRRVARGNGFVYVLVKADAVPSPQPGPPQSPPAAVPAPRLPPRANADGPSGGATARNNLLEDPRRRRVDGRLGADAPIAFDPSDLDHMVVSPPLAELLAALENRRPGDDLTIRRFDVRPFDRVSVIIDLNLNYTGGLQRARHRVYDLLVRVGYVGRPAESADTTPPAGPPVVQSPTAMLDAVAPLQFREISGQYVFALLTPAQIRMLVMLERRRVPAKRAVYRLWPDHIVETQALPIGALSTIKADAARAT
ncbi:MAG: Lipase-activating protease, partial [Rhizobacter sp.]|nr:Lipase-activating protease [Rhizobacter sp.]